MQQKAQYKYLSKLEHTFGVHVEGVKINPFAMAHTRGQASLLYGSKLMRKKTHGYVVANNRGISRIVMAPTIAYKSYQPII